MNRLTKLTAALAILTATTPVHAQGLSFEQVQNELADMSCSGSSCTSSSTTQTITKAPDTQVSVSESNAPNGGSESCFTADMFGHPFKRGPQCYVPMSLSPTTGGYSIPGAISCANTTTTTTKTIGFDPGAGFSVGTSTSSSSSAC